MGQSRYSDIPDPEGVQSLIYRVREERARSLQGQASEVEQLEMLARLHREGVLTEEEFQRKKRELLGE